MLKKLLLLLLLGIHAPRTYTMQETIDEIGMKAFNSLQNAGFPCLPEDEKGRLSNDNLRLFDRLCSEKDPSIIDLFSLVPCSNEHERITTFMRDFTDYVMLVNRYKSGSSSSSSSDSSDCYTNSHHSTEADESAPSSQSSSPIARPRVLYTVEVIDDQNDNNRPCISFTFTPNPASNTSE